MSIYIRLTSEELRGWIDQFPEAVNRALDAAIPTIQEMARGLTPQDTGNLAQSIEVTRQGYGLRVRWTAPYAKWVEHGAEPHEILPVRAKALRFMDRSGTMIFAKRVEHPGYPGWEFQTRVRELLMQTIKTFLQFTLQAISRRR